MRIRVALGDLFVLSVGSAFAENGSMGAATRCGSNGRT